MSDPIRNTAGFTHREVLTIISGLMLALFLAALNQTVVATALPRIAADLQGSAHLTWIIAAYLLASTAATPIYGKLSDMYGRRLLLQIALGTFILTSMLCAVAASMPQLILFRALQGLGGGGLTALTLSIVADIMPPRDRGRYQAHLIGVYGFASIIGPALGGFLADTFSWRLVFWINAPIGLLAVLVSHVTLKRLVSRRVGHRIDYPGAILIVAAICCLLLVTTMGGNDVPWNSPIIAGLVGLTIVFFGLATWQERRAPEPIISPQFFRIPIFVSMNAAGLCASACMIGCTIFVPIYMQIVHGQQATSSGIMLIPLTAASITGNVISGRVIAKTGRYRILPILGQTLAACGMLALAFAPPGAALWLIALTLFVTGMGYGIGAPALSLGVQNAVPQQDVGAATATITAVRSIGGSLGVALLGAVLLAALNSYAAGLISGSDSPAGIALLRAAADALAMARPGEQELLGMALGSAFQVMFSTGACVNLTAVLLLFFVSEVPLRTR